MRPLTKFGLGLVAVLGLAESLMVMALAWPLPAVRSLLLLYWTPLHWVLLGLAAFTAVVFLVMLLVALLRRSSTQNLVLKNDRGALTVSKQAVENAVAKAVAARHAVKAVDVAAVMHHDQVSRATIEAYSLERGDLAAQGAAIEATAKQKLEDLLGVPVQRVNVTLHPAAAAPGKAARVL